MPRESREDRSMGPREQVMIAAASRVGLSDEPPVIQKALELERLLNTHLTSGGGFSDYCRNVICLDLASQILDVPTDKVSMIKQSGLKKSAYRSARGAAENLLQMRGDLSVAGACVKLQCILSEALAEDILTEYSKRKEIDQSHPQYLCMAIYQACRISNIKVSKNKLLSMCELKPTQWARMEESWTKFVDENFVKDQSGNIRIDSTSVQSVDDTNSALSPKGSHRTPTTPHPSADANSLQSHTASFRMSTTQRPPADKNEEKEEVKPKELEQKEVIEPKKELNPKIEFPTEAYENWQKRILVEAFIELKELGKREAAAAAEIAAQKRLANIIQKGLPKRTGLENCTHRDNDSPRKSPRNKQNPAPVMDRSKGVRLTF